MTMRYFIQYCFFTFHKGSFTFYFFSNHLKKYSSTLIVANPKKKNNPQIVYMIIRKTRKNVLSVILTTEPIC